MAQLMQGGELSSKIISAVKEETARLARHGIRAGLALLLVGEEKSSFMYYQAIQSAAIRAGIDIFNHTLPASASLNEILNLIKTPMPKGQQGHRKTYNHMNFARKDCII